MSSCRILSSAFLAFRASVSISMQYGQAVAIVSAPRSYGTPEEVTLTDYRSRSMWLDLVEEDLTPRRSLEGPKATTRPPFSAPTSNL